MKSGGQPLSEKELKEWEERMNLVLPGKEKKNVGVISVSNNRR